MARLLKMYECEHCNKVLRKTKKGIDNHEAKCFSNLATKSCITCENFYEGGWLGEASVDALRAKRTCYEGVCLKERLQTNCSQWEERDPNRCPDEYGYPDGYYDI